MTDVEIIPYRAKGAAAKLFRCNDPEVLIEGPSNTGKTRAVLEKVNWLAVRYPGSRHLISRKTRTSMSESVLQIYEDRVLRPVDRDRVRAGADRRHRMSYNHFGNGSLLVICGLDNVDRIMSAEYDTFSLFEATEATQHDWETIVGTRLRNGMMPFAQAIADCNPGPPNHWLNQRANRGLMTRLHSRHADNPTVTEQYLEGLRRLTGHRRARLYEGKWLGAEGLVYERFDPAIHVVDPFPVPEDWPKFMGIDFGYNHPMVAVWLARSPDGDIYVYRELHESGRLITSVAEEIKRLTGDEEIRARWCEHDPQQRKLLELASVYTDLADKGPGSVEHGIQAVQDLLVVDQNTGRPRFYVMRDSLVRRDENWAGMGMPASLVEEFQTYAWDRSADGTMSKETPKKIGDDALDALRYAIVGVRMWAGEGALLGFS